MRTWPLGNEAVLSIIKAFDGRGLAINNLIIWLIINVMALNTIKKTASFFLFRYINNIEIEISNTKKT